MSGEKFIMVTIDVECDKDITWHTRHPLSFKGALDGVPNKLQPLFEKYGIHPTYLLSPEVIVNPNCRDIFNSIPNCELGSHLHGDYIVPQIKTWNLAGAITSDMQWEYPPELEREKLEVLTQMFIQQFGYQPLSFRAGRFGIGHHTGKWLAELGYKVDTSVTPHITWTSSKGKKSPDFQSFPETPYRISCDGDIWRTGYCDLLEVPVTVVTPSQSNSTKPLEPIWFRPWYSDAKSLCAVVDLVAEESARSVLHRPLVMMFHNVEVIPGTSPYPQTDEQVSQYLDSLSGVFDYALQKGYKPCTLSEYYVYHASTYIPVFNISSFTIAMKTHDTQLRLSSKYVHNILAKHQTPPWFKSIFDNRVSRWDVCLPGLWIVENIMPDKNILETGCGVGFNLLWLAEQGFERLSGFDIDPRTINAGIEISKRARLPLNLWVDDGLSPKILSGTVYSVIMALNWTFLLDGFSLTRYLEIYLPHLEEYGVLIFDVIDSAFDQVPDNQYQSSDLNKPVDERRPSEYKIRMSEEEVKFILSKHGLQIVQIITEEQKIPKKVYVAGKHSLFEIYQENHKHVGETKPATSFRLFTFIKMIKSFLKEMIKSFQSTPSKLFMFMKKIKSFLKK